MACLAASTPAGALSAAAGALGGSAVGRRLPGRPAGLGLPGRLCPLRMMRRTYLFEACLLAGGVAGAAGFPRSMDTGVLVAGALIGLMGGLGSRGLIEAFAARQRVRVPAAAGAVVAFAVSLGLAGLLADLRDTLAA